MESSRFGLLRRLHAGSARRANVSDALRKAGVPESFVSFLPLSESDAVRQKAAVSFCGRDDMESGVMEKRIAHDNQAYVEGLVPASCNSVYIFLSDAEIVGVLQWPVEVFNAKWVQLIEVDPDGFIVVDSAFASKMVVQVTDDFSTGEGELNIAAWGDSWRNYLSSIRNI